MATLINDEITLQITDAHVHLWDLSKLSYPWLEEVPAIKRPFGLSEYLEATQGVAVSNVIFVQAECLPAEYQAEVDYVTKLAAECSRIRGIVAYFPLEQSPVDELLEKLAANKLVKGIRRLEEGPDALYNNPHFVRNLRLLRPHGLSFDLCVKAHQMAGAVNLVKEVPDNRYILDHFGKPAIGSGEFRQWCAHIKELAKNPTVYCKLSGLVTEADWANWTIADLQPYVDIVMEHFGPNRVAFGSDWPVVTLASSYSRWYETAVQLCDGLSQDELNRVFYQNALDFYEID